MNKIEIRKGIQLRKIGNRYMIVDGCAGNVNMSKVYSLIDGSMDMAVCS